MIKDRRFQLILFLFIGLVVTPGVFAQPSVKIDVNNMTPAGHLTDEYSFMSQPHSFYYFHNMDKLDFHTDWIEKADRLAKAVHYASSLGFTRLISAGADAESVKLFDGLRQRGELTTHLYMARFINPPLTPEFINGLEEKRKKYNDDWTDLNTVKFLMDGVIESNTAAMLEPYTNDPANSGFFLFDSELYRKSVAEFDRLGFTISTHAIGDATVRLALDAYEAAAKTNGTADARHRIEHIEAPSAQDIPRFGKLGVIAAVQLWPLAVTGRS